MGRYDRYGEPWPWECARCGRGSPEGPRCESCANLPSASAEPVALPGSQGQPMEAFVDLPGSHKAGHEAAPKGYSAYYAGMDVGVTDHPSEILRFGPWQLRSGGLA